MKSESTIEQGFAVLPDVFSNAEISEISAATNELNSVGTRCLLDEQWCQTVATDLRNRMTSLIPQIRELSAVQCTYFNKTSDSNWFVAFHQDRSIPVHDATPRTFNGWSRKQGMTFIQPPDEILTAILAFRLHLDDSTESNGPLRVLPQTHTMGTLTLEQIESFRNSVASRKLTIDRGGVVAMRPLLLHASSKSNSECDRRVLHFLFGPPKLPDGLSWRMAV